VRAIEKPGYRQSLDLLLKKYSTGVICYSEKNLLRIAFASTPLDKIESLFTNIYSACKDCVVS